MTRTPPSDSVSRPVTSAVDLCALSKDGADFLEAVLQHENKSAHDGEDRKRYDHAAMQKIDKRENRGAHATDKLNQSRADEVAHAFHIAHDARHQRASTVLVVIGDRQQAHVLLHLPSHIGDQALARLREQAASARTR